MTNRRTLLAALFLVAVALETLGCGMSNRRVLQSMTISPASADAQNFPKGQVQFTATGFFSKPPSPQQMTFQPPYFGGWLLTPNGQFPVASISQTGLAQCIAGQSGTSTVIATAASNAGIGTEMTAVEVRATATLTCP
jgi:hypothetical protein